VDRSVDAAPSEKVSSDDSQTSVDNIKTKKFPVPDKEQGITAPLFDLDSDISRGLTAALDKEAAGLSCS
jgi:hypothetical protein